MLIADLLWEAQGWVFTQDKKWLFQRSDCSFGAPQFETVSQEYPTKERAWTFLWVSALLFVVEGLQSQHMFKRPTKVSQLLSLHDNQQNGEATFVIVLGWIHFFAHTFFSPTVVDLCLWGSGSPSSWASQPWCTSASSKSVALPRTAEKLKLSILSLSAALNSHACLVRKSILLRISCASSWEIAAEKIFLVWSLGVSRISAGRTIVQEWLLLWLCCGNVWRTAVFVFFFRKSRKFLQRWNKYRSQSKLQDWWKLASTERSFVDQRFPVKTTTTNVK